MTININKQLDDIIFNKLGGKYQKGLNVDDNLQNDEEKTKIYLGTYFPRSYAEICYISHQLFDNPFIKNHYSNLKEISILDIGAGTGGDMLGIIYSIHLNFPRINTINLYTIDGNEIAIKYQKFFTNIFNTSTLKNVRLNSVKHVFINNGFENELDTIISNWGDLKFDFIVSSKFFSELYNKNPETASGLYNSFVNKSEKYLKEKGLSILIDVTTKDRYSKRQFTPYIMNKEISNYLKCNDDNIKIILPLSCAFWYKRCLTNNCFSQNLFYIKHSRASFDKSKICYAVFAKSNFADSILSVIIPQEKYSICFKENGCDGYCVSGVQIKEKLTTNISAFKLI